jgi:L-threonylcarbamoyladenylate synthase
LVIEVSEVIEQAADILKRGGLVAFPTETVYGLGADARNADAIKKIFAVKGRPATNPLIVHVSGVAMAKLYSARWPHTARVLAQAFWPGPLTLVLPKVKEIVPEATAGLDSVALRMPDHSVAIDLIRKFDGPIAAPSANRSTHISPTTANHVRREFGSDVECVIDGGPCKFGIESTVLDLTSNLPRILRPGSITREQLQAYVGEVEMKSLITDIATAAASPGQQEVHYAPRTPAYRFDLSQLAQIDRMEDAGFLFVGEPGSSSERRITLANDPHAYAHDLYAALRQLDELNLRAIYVQSPPDAPEWAAVRDRLRRATRPMA